MIPGGRGDFLVKADGVTVWDKRKTGEFPSNEAIVEKLAA
jgi:selT/selW/selH-like putative selenoprotein